MFQIIKIRKINNIIIDTEYPELIPINGSLIRSLISTSFGRGGFFFFFFLFLLEDFLSNERTPFYEKFTTVRSTNRVSFKI